MKVSVKFSALNYLKSTSVVLLITSFGLSSKASAQAQPSNAGKQEAKTNQHVDYTLAVNELLKLGFPNAKGAKYMKLSSRNLSYTSGLFNENMGSPKGLTGNVFFIPAKDKKGKTLDRVILQGGVEYTYSKSRSGGGMSGPLKEADLKKDLKATAAWIRKSSVSDDDWSYKSTRRCVVAFGFANLAYHAGYKKEATELFKAVFLSHDNPTKVIDAVINTIATKEYNKVYMTFNEKGNWQDYLDDLLRLQKKFPRGWTNQPGLEILIPQVRKRAENKAVTYPTVAGHTFKPEIMKLVKAVYEPQSESRNRYSDKLFLINKPKKLRGSSPLVDLTSYGMDGFIAICSMIGDETLVTSRGGGGYDHFGTRYYSSSDDEISPEAAYQSLSKPSTVGSLAVSLIRNALPHPRDTLNQISNDGLKQLAIEWWKMHKNDSTIELTKHYLKLGNQNHTSQLSASLLKQNTKESLELLVSSILSSDTPSEYQDVAKKYVVKQRASAKDFITKYEAALRKEIGEGKDQDYSTNGQYYIKEMGGTTKYIAKLKRYTEPLDPVLLLNMLSRKKAKTKDLLEQLVVAYQGKDISKNFSKFIYAMAKADDNKCEYILEALVKITYRVGEADEKSKQLEKPAKPSFSKYEKEDIQKLLGSERFVWFDHSRMSTTVAIQFGMILDKVYNPSRKHSDYDFMPYLELEEVTKIITVRSKAIIEGKELKALPNAKAVKPERLKELTALLKKSPPTTMRKVFQTLSINERLALVVQETNSDSKVFSEGDKFIQGVEINNKEAKNREAMLTLLQPLIGSEYSAQGIEKICQFLLKNNKQTAGSLAIIYNRMQRPGVDLNIELDTYNKDDKIEALNKKVIAGEIDAYTAVMIYNDENKVSEMVVFGDNSKVNLEDITAMIKNEESAMRILTINKDYLEKQIALRKKTLPERTKLLKEIVKMYPHYKQSMDRFQELRLADLKGWHARMKKQYDAEQAQLKEAESEDGSSTDGFRIPSIK